MFLHGDEDARAERLKLVDELNEKRLIVGSAGVAVPLVPVLMTESWMLADRKALESVVGKELLTDYPYTRPAAVEGRVAMRRSKEKLTPKQVWTNLMGDDANEILHDRSELLAQRTDLRVLAQLPSYREWCDGVERALRTLGFL
ncbi:hypothetical protein ABTX82_28075 [Streptomyces lavendulae]|uniref:hypothetical protein n=1 Tax=Streptomyces lavendulae TaxID=1914 RepID=UPI0033273D17